MSCQKIDRTEEEGILVKGFILFLVVQTLFALALFGTIAFFLTRAELNWFLPFDLLTLTIAVIILSFIILVTGVASGLSNVLFAWILFHAFIVVLLVAELLMSWLSSDNEGFLKVAHQTWLTAADEDITEVQHSFRCCGFANVSDRPAGSICPANFDQSCHEALSDTLKSLRNWCSVGMFVDFVFAMFIDFAGCGICFHPDFVPLDQIREETDEAESFAQSQELSIQSLASDPLLGRKTHRD
jgi:hypothetical protein